MSKPIVLHGVGILKAFNFSDKADVIRLATLQELRFSFNQTSENQFGGDGLFPIDTWLRERTVEVSTTSAAFDMNMLSTVLGGSVLTAQSETIDEFNEGYYIPNATPYTVTLSQTTIVLDSERVYYADTLIPFQKVTAGSEAAGKYSIAGNVLTFAAADAGKGIIVDYQYTVTDAESYNMVIDSLPGFVEIRHKFSFKNADGVEKKGEIIIYKATVNSPFELTFSRGAGSTHNITFNVVDPGRPDKRIAKIIRLP